MLKSRLQAEEKKGTPKVKIKTSIQFDDQCSSNSTLVQVVAQDRPGLLHTVASCFANHKCNIEIASSIPKANGDRCLLSHHEPEETGARAPETCGSRIASGVAKRP